MRSLLFAFSLLIILTGSSLAPARTQVEQPNTANPRFTVRSRYRIEAGRTQRHRLYQAMLQRLAKAGFVKDKGLEGEELYGSTFSGTIPHAGLQAFLADPLIRTTVAIPGGYQPPPATQNTALVRLYLSTDFGQTRQRQVSELALGLLKQLAFVEAAAYKHHDHRILIGRLPVDRLDELLTEKTESPVPPGLGQEGGPSHSTALIRMAEVLPEPADYAPLPSQTLTSTVPADKASLHKLSPQLRSMLEKLPEEERSKLARIELLLRDAPGSEEIHWRETLTRAPFYMDIEGRLGPVVTGRISHGYIEDLAKLPGISTIRLPRSADALNLVADAQGMGSKGFRFVPLAPPDAMQHRTHQPLRSVGGERSAIVIGGDFRGFERHVGKTLPANTKLVDATSELSPELEPLPNPDDGVPEGEGTKLAIAYQKIVSAEQLFLVRVDSRSPGQIAELARVLNGAPWKTEALSQRLMDLNREQVQLRNEEFQLQVQRRILQNNFNRDAESKAAWDKYHEQRAKVESLQQTLGERMGRYNRFVAQFAPLRKAENVLLALHWTHGYPNSPDQPPVMRYLDPDLLRSASWMQVVPTRTGQVWKGLFRDANEDGVMEFTGAKESGRADLNFLAWETPAGKTEATLPQGVEIGVDLQWQEVHDPRLFAAQDDPYRQPNAPLQIVVLRQRDPEGKTLPSDLFEEVARTTAWPDRLKHAPRWSQYQQHLRFKVEQPGRYAIRIEGRVPMSTMPTGGVQLVQERGELEPKLVVHEVGTAGAAKGRVLLQDYHTPE